MSILKDRVLKLKEEFQSGRCTVDKIWEAHEAGRVEGARIAQNKGWTKRGDRPLAMGPAAFWQELGYEWWREFYFSEIQPNLKCIPIKGCNHFTDKLCPEAWTNCLIWMERVSNLGYGWAWLDERNQRAHRVAWQLHSGQKLLRGIFVCHSCDQPSCCQWKHLWLGDNSDNCHDRELKGRGDHGFRLTMPVGEKHGSAKLSDVQVAELRRELAELNKPRAEVARKYGISVTHVNRLRLGQRRSTKKAKELLQKLGGEK